ncbi:GntR family transcriptional regulator [Nocardioides marmorisolisilvae]|uniref:GntR family transcriptional regulator n=1 Tax=Nocardioides marmorisolisilvae TaxID=1542737 RepID=A0A3N0DPP5_9ACTN|nr:GntR family transcriptional regulator [Nocardioides marmorisolisilvae]RNL77627.1 GntR family transcriptional regulator [Nocardioides marmorisolisilvae]
MTDSVANGLHLDRALLSEQIYTHIKKMIKDGTLEPGDQVVEYKLAREMGVSQAPVREALKRLVHDGIVTNIPRNGNFVSRFSTQEAEDARVGRVALEEMAARLACGRLQEQDLVNLNDLIEQMREAAERRDLSAFREHDFAFHRAVVQATRNTYLPRMWDIVEPSLRSFDILSDPAFKGDWRVAAEWHQDLLDALVSSTPGEAAALFARHAASLAGNAEGDLEDVLRGGQPAAGAPS